jgi:hypothetical protein
MSIDEALKLLGLEGGESLEQIRRAFRKKAMQYHPDHYRNFSQQAWATKRFIKVKNAYDFLMNSNAFVQESSAMSSVYESSSDQNQEKPDYSKEGLNKTFSLFDWVLDRMPKEDTFWGWIISIPLGIIYMIGLAPYGIVLRILQDIIIKFGLEPYPDSNTRKGRFAFLTITTLSALIYLPVFFYLIYTSSQNNYPATIRIAIGIILTSMVILFVLSEWIGYFLMEIWRTSVKTDIVPIKRKE